MRIFPIISAIVAAIALYFIVIERDMLFDFVSQQTSAASTDETADSSDTAVSSSDATPTEIQVSPEKLVKVVARDSVARPLENAVIVRGRTEAARQVELRAETSGKVISEPLRKGSRVQEGEVICRLDPGTRQVALAEAVSRLAEAEARLPEAEARIPEAEARLLEAQSRLAEAMARRSEAIARLEEADLNARTAQTLETEGFASKTRVANALAALESAKSGVSSAESALEGVGASIASAEAGVASASSAVESAKAGIASAEASVARARTELERLEIAAPFSGILETDAAELGALLQQGSLCATVIQLEPIRLVGFIPETDVSKVSIGAPAAARLATGEEVFGNVNFLSRSADEATRTFRVEVEVANGEGRIRDGQTAEMLLATAGQTAHLLAQSSLTLNNEGLLGVRIVDENDIVRFTPVDIVRDSKEGVWVTGLPDSARIITIGQEYVTDGVQVAVTLEETKS